MPGFCLNPYKILRVAPGATAKEILKDYRHMARQYHPDHKQGDPEAEEKFKQVQWAYETLMGKEKKVLMPGKFHQHESPFSRDGHPFTGFFWAMRAYSERIKMDKSD